VSSPGRGAWAAASPLATESQVNATNAAVVFNRFPNDMFHTPLS
jgi:hypothetical protein